MRLRSLEGEFDLNNCAVLSREWQDLDLLRSIFEAHDLPTNLHWGRSGGFPSLTKIRENAMLLDYLQQHKMDSLTGSSLLDFLPNQPTKDNLWQTNLRVLLNDWIEETHDTEQPVSLIEDYLYEALSDQSHSRNLGNGIFLSTVHSVKGLEFDHVFILGENWQEKTADEAEEERRLYYVAMSRARATLQLFSIKDIANPHVSLLSGEFHLQRELHPTVHNKQMRKHYALLGMKDLYLDFAGAKKEQHPARLALGELTTGDALSLELRNEHLELINDAGVSVARLSKSAKQKWLKSLEKILEIRVIALVRRNKDAISDEIFREKCFGEMWEVPLVEMTLSASANCK